MKKSNLSFDELTICVNYALINGKLPITLKNTNVTPVHKKDDPTDKTNFGPVSVLPLLSKVLERVIYNQLVKYMDTFLNKLLCGFRKAHSTQHALFKLLQWCQKGHLWVSGHNTGGPFKSRWLLTSWLYNC